MISENRCIVVNQDHLTGAWQKHQRHHILDFPFINVSEKAKKPAHSASMNINISDDQPAQGPA